MPSRLKPDQLKQGGARVGVITGMDPHKRAATIEIVDDRGQVLAVGRYGTDKAGCAEMRGRERWPLP